MIKKIRLIVPVSAILFGLFNVTPPKVQAFSGSGIGNETYPYRITTCEQLDEIRNNSSSYFVLMNDLTCEDSWSPVGFNGHFDGRNHTISGLEITNNGSYTGFFSILGFGSTVKNLTLDGMSVTATAISTAYTGALAGKTDRAVIDDVHVIGDVRGRQVVGGFVGEVTNITNINRSSFTGDVSDLAGYGGGFAGRIYNSAIADSYANANYSGTNTGGGFAAVLISDSANNAMISNSYTIGSVTNQNYTSGFVSMLSETSTGNVYVNDSFSVVSGYNGTNNIIYPFASVSSGTPSVNNFYYDSYVAGSPAHCGAGFTCTAVNADNSDAEHFVGLGVSAKSPLTGVWDFTNDWQEVGGLFPQHRDQTLTTLANIVAPDLPENVQVSRFDSIYTSVSWDAPTDVGGSPITNYSVGYRMVGDTDWFYEDVGDSLNFQIRSSFFDPGDNIEFIVAAENDVDLGDYTEPVEYTLPALPDPEISDCQDLQDISEDVSFGYYLTGPIDCEGFDFVPINAFYGELDGRGYAINNLEIINVGSSEQGIFATTSQGARIIDLTVNDALIQGDYNVGILVGQADQDIVISNVDVSGEVDGIGSVGGLIGSFNGDGDSDESGLIIQDSNIDVGLYADGVNSDDGWGGAVGYFDTYYLGYVDVEDNNISVEMDANTSNDGSVGGIFGYFSSTNTYTTISNNTVDTWFNASNQIGGIAGYISFYWEDPGENLGELNSENNQVVVSNEGDYSIGGLYGYIDMGGTVINISKSSTSGAMYAGDGYAGGLVGEFYGEDDHQVNILKSFSTVQIDVGTSDVAGGLIGLSGGVSYVDNAYYHGPLYGKNQLGGLVGVGTNYLTINRSYSAGSINSSTGMSIGGIIGDMQDGSIENTFSAIAIDSTSLTTVGGINGTIFDGTVNAFVDMYHNSIGCRGTIGIGGSADVNCSEVNDGEGSIEEYYYNTSAIEPFVNEIDQPVWNFDNTWASQENNFPDLQWHAYSNPTPIIASCSDLQHMQYALDHSYNLAQDVDCEGFDFEPIGSESQPFIGSLDGNGYKILNLTIDQSGNDIGLFGYISSATLTDVILEGGDVSGEGNVGALVGSADGIASITGCTSDLNVAGTGTNIGGLVGLFNSGGIFSNNNSTGDVDGFERVGGLIGGLYGSTITDSHATGDVYSVSTYAGGLIGRSASTNIEQSYATGMVSGGENYAGGLIGDDQSSNIRNSYARGDVTADLYYAGGLLGGSFASELLNTYATGDVISTLASGGLIGYNNSGSSVTNSFAVGYPEVTTEGPYFLSFNGIIGVDFYGEANYSNTYYNSDIGRPCASNDNKEDITNDECIPISIGENPGLFQLKDDEPLKQWDFDYVWQEEDNDYPTLQVHTGPNPDADYDGDGITDVVEQAGPNGGDANGDNIADVTQSFVASFVNPVTDKYVALIAGEDIECQIINVSVNKETKNSVQDAGYDYSQGLMNFHLSCGQQGGTASIRIIYFDVNKPDQVARKYNDNTKGYADIQGAKVTTAKLFGKNTTQISYDVKDGGSLDQDGLENSEITDPVGLAAAITEVPNTGFERQ